MSKVDQQPEAVEEDYRVKNAREGRAFYIPGKTDDQVKAEQQRRETEEFQVTLRMTAKDADVKQALEDAQYLFGHAAEAFTTLHNGLSGGWLNEEPGAASLCYLAGIALRHKADTDGETLLGHFAKLQGAVYQARNQDKGEVHHADDQS